MSTSKKKDGNVLVRLFSEHTNAILIACLVFCPPVGLYMMWKNWCRWERWVKALVSIAIVAMFTVVIIVLPDPPNPLPEGGVEIQVMTKNKKAFGPFKPEGVPDTVQVLVNASETSSLISEPTPTPDPIRVYCNDNGLYYHYAECRYVYDTTPRVTLLQAINAGKKACSECNPPSEVSY